MQESGFANEKFSNFVFTKQFDGKGATVGQS